MVRDHRHTAYGRQGRSRQSSRREGPPPAARPAARSGSGHHEKRHYRQSRTSLFDAGIPSPTSASGGPDKSTCPTATGPGQDRIHRCATNGWIERRGLGRTDGPPRFTSPNGTEMRGPREGVA
jgi:hypothetical protein